MKAVMTYYKSYMEAVVQLFPELRFDQSKLKNPPSI